MEQRNLKKKKTKKKKKTTQPLTGGVAKDLQRMPTLSHGVGVLARQLTQCSCKTFSLFLIPCDPVLLNCPVCLNWLLGERVLWELKTGCSLVSCRYVLWERPSNPSLR